MSVRAAGPSYGKARHVHVFAEVYVFAEVHVHVHVHLLAQAHVQPHIISRPGYTLLQNMPSSEQYRMSVINISDTVARYTAPVPFSWEVHHLIDLPSSWHASQSVV